MAAPSSQERELQLLDKVELKILAVANKETKLHELLQRYLAPVLLKAASEHVPVRRKVSHQITSAVTCAKSIQVLQMFAMLKTFIQAPEYG